MGKSPGVKFEFGSLPKRTNAPTTIETVTRDMIQKTWQEIKFRLDVSRAINGAHIEMY
jgi:hypothetical protein